MTEPLHPDVLRRYMKRTGKDIDAEIQETKTELMNDYAYHTLAHFVDYLLYSDIPDAKAKQQAALKVFSNSPELSKTWEEFIEKEALDSLCESHRRFPIDADYLD